MDKTLQTEEELKQFMTSEEKQDKELKLTINFSPNKEEWNGIIDKAFSLLQKAGTLQIIVLEQDQQVVERELKLCGFLDVQTKDESISRKLLCATKPTYDPSISVAIPTGNSISLSSAKEAANVWKQIDVSDSKQELINESELLPLDDVRHGGISKNGCSTGRKACANCTCGKADKLKEEKSLTLTKETLMETQPTSSCGNCYRGDAFRCASCPYLGLPPFKPGEKIVLGSQFTSDL
eukprot:jgi/Galph1/2580/GphlegSOOS_G1234.1